MSPAWRPVYRSSQTREITLVISPPSSRKLPRNFPTFAEVPSHTSPAQTAHTFNLPPESILYPNKKEITQVISPPSRQIPASPTRPKRQHLRIKYIEKPQVKALNAKRSAKLQPSATDDYTLSRCSPPRTVFDILFVRAADKSMQKCRLLGDLCIAPAKQGNHTRDFPSFIKKIASQFPLLRNRLQPHPYHSKRPHLRIKYIEKPQVKALNAKRSAKLQPSATDDYTLSRCSPPRTVFDILFVRAADKSMQKCRLLGDLCIAPAKQGKSHS